MSGIFRCFPVFFFCSVYLFAVDAGTLISSTDLTTISKTQGGALYLDTINGIADSSRQNYSRQYPYVTEIELSDDQAQNTLKDAGANNQFLVMAKLNRLYDAVLFTVITQSEKKLYIYTKYKLDEKSPLPFPPAAKIKSDEETAGVFAQIDELNKDEGPLEVIEKTTNKDGSANVSYKVSDSVTRTVYTDAAGNRQLLQENITVSESYNDAVEKYTKIFTEEAPYFRGGFEAKMKVNAAEWFFSKYPKPYKGIIIIRGSIMNGQEYRYKQRFVTERRWYKKPYFDKIVKTLGPQAGFIAFFDNVQGVHIEDDEDNGTVQTYVFDR